MVGHAPDRRRIGQRRQGRERAFAHERLRVPQEKREHGHRVAAQLRQPADRRQPLIQRPERDLRRERYRRTIRARRGELRREE